MKIYEWLPNSLGRSEGHTWKLKLGMMLKLLRTAPVEPSATTAICPN